MFSSMRCWLPLLLLCALASPSWAASSKTPAATPKKTAPAAPAPTFLGGFGDWRAYQTTQQGAPVCFAQTSASNHTKLAKRQVPTLNIAMRPLENALNVVSYHAGMRLLPGQPIMARIGEAEWRLFSTRWTGWARDSRTDQELVKAMRAARGSITLRARNNQQQNLQDSFSLNGVSAALTAISRACGLPAPPKN